MHKWLCIALGYLQVLHVRSFSEPYTCCQKVKTPIYHLDLFGVYIYTHTHIYIVLVNMCCSLNRKEKEWGSVIHSIPSVLKVPPFQVGLNPPLWECSLPRPTKSSPNGHASFMQGGYQSPAQQKLHSLLIKQLSLKQGLKFHLKSGKSVIFCILNIPKIKFL